MRDIRQRLWYEYLRYLLKGINFNKKEWYDVLKDLHSINFYWDDRVPMDENRALDGVYERKYFFKDMGVRGEFLFPCSVVEMLVALSKRISDEYVYAKGGDEDETWIIFLFFVKNLGINPDTSKETLTRNVKFWLKRDYMDDGIGSILPLSHRVKGYHLMEIWSQINIFLNEENIKNVEDFL